MTADLDERQTPDIALTILDELRHAQQPVSTGAVGSGANALRIPPHTDARTIAPDLYYLLNDLLLDTANTYPEDHPRHYRIMDIRRTLQNQDIARKETTP